MTSSNKINYAQLYAISKEQYDVYLKRKTLKCLKELNVEELKYRTLKQRNAADALLNSTCKSSSSAGFNGQQTTFNGSFNDSGPRASTPLNDQSRNPTRNNTSSSNTSSNKSLA